MNIGTEKNVLSHSTDNEVEHSDEFLRLQIWRGIPEQP